MSLSGPWRALGVEPTTDQAAIRRAYADALRAIDVDADPAGFARLRDAREAALAWARNPSTEDEVEDDHWSDEDEEHDADVEAYRAVFSERELFDMLGMPGGAGRDAPPPGDATPRVEIVPDDAPAARASPWAVPAIDYDAHYQAVLDLLFDGGDEPLAPERAAELGRHVDTLLLDPRLDEIDFRDRAERWFADVMSDAGERSDPIVERVVARFGWDADRGRIDQPWAMNWATTRAEAVRFLRRVVEPDHPYHQAWRELTRPDGVRRPWRLDRAKVRKLLQAIRVEHPELEERLVPARVKRWEPGRAHRLFGSINLGGYLTWIALAGLIFLVRACPLDRRDSTPVATDLTSPVADLPQAMAKPLAAVGGDELTPERLQRENPALFLVARGWWERARRERESQHVFDLGLRGLLRARVHPALRHADYDLAVRFREAELDAARHARRRGDEACDRFWQGLDQDDPADATAEAIERRRAGIQGELLLRHGHHDAIGDDRVLVPGPVLDQVARRTGLPRDRIGEVLRDGGAPATRCAARIALVETALGSPRDEGLRLLRTL